VIRDLEEWGWEMAEQWHPDHTIFRQVCKAEGITNGQYANLVASGVARTDDEVKANDERESQ
jgi:hypothetical protein